MLRNGLRAIVDNKTIEKENKWTMTLQSSSKIGKLSTQPSERE